MKNKPKIGNLRHMVEIKNASTTSDDAGGFSESYSTVANVFASITPKRGTEVYSDGQNAMQIENPITHEIFIRYRDDITLNNSSKIIFGERQFNVRSILNIEEKNRFFKIEAQENVAI